jgi:hypothetical protein
MCPDVEEEIRKLGPELSKVYFEAKEELAKSHDSRSERFSFAARIVRAFWNKFHLAKPNPDNHSNPDCNGGG